MYVIMVLTPNIPFSCDEFRFRWAYCQLESLRQCPLRHIPSTLGELPGTLDETYERILQGIPKKMQKDAHHIFQWLLVSSRPLRVKEVAEVFAINFDEKISGIPKFKPSWRVPNAETAVLSACSTLVSIVDAGWRGKIVQFSHFSAKEYLTSDRIANAEHVSHFYIRPKLAHTLLAKACLSVLFQREYSIYEAKIKNFPLAEYAAKHWVEHARFEDVSSYIRDGMDLLFEKDKPHFASWIWLHNIDDEYDIYNESTAHLRQPDAVPLYYAALCGFRGLVQRLLTAYPRDLNAEGGVYGAPLNAALAQGHLDIALFLLDRGAEVDNRGKADQTGLYIASSRGYAGIVRSLIDASAELNAIYKDHDEDGNIVKRTPLHVAIYEEHRDIAILLLDHGADTEIRSSANQTALYMASSRGHADVVRALIDCGADLNVQCDDWMDDVVDVTWTPLHAAIYDEHRDVALLLLEGGADTESRNSGDETALYMASSRGCADIVWQLISHGADLNALCTDFDMYDNDVKWTLLHVASCNGIPPIARLLLERIPTRWITWVELHYIWHRPRERSGLSSYSSIMTRMWMSGTRTDGPRCTRQHTFYTCMLWWPYLTVVQIRMHRPIRARHLSSWPLHLSRWCRRRTKRKSYDFSHQRENVGFTVMESIQKRVSFGGNDHSYTFAFCRRYV